LDINSSSDFALEETISNPPMINNNPDISSKTLFSVIEKNMFSNIGCDAIAKTFRSKKPTSGSMAK
jgi:hypothetical protein